MLLEHKVGGVPVVDREGLLVGIVTESNVPGEEAFVPFSVLRLPRLFGHWLGQEGIPEICAKARRLSARAIVARSVITVTKDDPVSEVVRRMIHHRVHCVPVVRDGRLVGIIARHDLLRLIAGEDETTPRAG